MKDEEGRIEVDGHRVWYRRVGAGSTPLLVLHGGPGSGHDYLEPLEGLAASREVVFYDQLGCGRSDQPDDPSLWRIERFVREVDTVRAALGLDRIDAFQRLALPGERSPVRDVVLAALPTFQRFAGMEELGSRFKC